ncbi:MAG TPA: ABC transporter substrate-binding protein [Anaerolineae bacterium]
MTKDRRTKTFKRVRREIPVLVMAVALTLSGCSINLDRLRDSIPSTIATNAETPTFAAPKPTFMATSVPPTATVTPTSTPTPPKKISMAIIGEPETLHPLYASSRAAQTVLGALFVGCVGQDETGAPVALGCETVPTIENGGARWVGDGDDRHLEATFKIRQGWRWTDGQPVTSQDALFSWHTIMSPAAQANDALTQKVYQMSAPDDRTIVVSFMSAAQARLAAIGKLHGEVSFEYYSNRGDYDSFAKQSGPLADPNYWGVVRWLPEHLLKNVLPAQQLTAPYGMKPVGDGAFELAAWNKGSDLTLIRSAKPFPMSPQGNIASITFRFAKAEAVAAQWVRNGEVQLSVPIANNAFDRVPINANATLTQVVAPLVEQVVLNTDRFPFDSVKVRQALQLAINTTAIMQDPVVSPVTTSQVIDPAGMFYGLDGSMLRAHPDAAGARNLLSEDGWSCISTPCTRSITKKNGGVLTETLSFTLVTNQREPRNAVSQLIQSQLAGAGFELNVQIVAGLGSHSKLFAPFDEGGILISRNFDAALYQAPSLTRFSGVFDCASIPDAKAPVPSQGNTFGWCDKATDAAIRSMETGEAGVSTAGRTSLFASLITTLTQNALFVPLYSPVLVFPSHDVSGVKYAGNGVMTWNVWEWN